MNINIGTTYPTKYVPKSAFSSKFNEIKVSKLPVLKGQT